VLHCGSGQLSTLAADAAQLLSRFDDLMYGNRSNIVDDVHCACSIGYAKECFTSALLQSCCAAAMSLSNIRRAYLMLTAAASCKGLISAAAASCQAAQPRRLGSVSSAATAGARHQVGTPVGQRTAKTD
jgi:hypothetical protein